MRAFRVRVLERKTHLASDTDMCVQPRNISITTRGTSSFRSIMPTSYLVPCGTCPECRLAAQHSLFVRSYQEWKRCVLSNGTVLFVTFTYDDDHVHTLSEVLPRYESKYSFWNESTVALYNRLLGSDLSNVLCFDHYDIRKFVTALQRRFERAGVTRKFGYLFTSEFGETSTERPHYHALLYFTADQMAFLGRFDKQILATLHSVWMNGFCSASSQGLRVSDERAINYVTKYVDKNVSGASLDVLPTSYARILTCDSDGVVYSGEEYSVIKKLIARFLPKYRTSTNFGYCNFSYDVLLKGFDISLGNTLHHYDTPLYYLRKALYSKVPNTHTTAGFVYRLNELGVRYKVDSFDSRVDSLLSRYEKYVGKVFPYRRHDVEAAVVQHILFNTSAVCDRSILEDVCSDILAIRTGAPAKRVLSRWLRFREILSPELECDSYDTARFFVNPAIYEELCRKYPDEQPHVHFNYAPCVNYELSNVYSELVNLPLQTSFITKFSKYHEALKIFRAKRLLNKKKFLLSR